MRAATRKKLGKDPAYLEWLHTLPCAVCILPWKFYVSGVSFTNVQKTRTEAAHVGERGMSQKCPDNEAIPLCAEHHREGPESQHRLQRNFWERHGLDRQKLIGWLQSEFAIEWPVTTIPLVGSGQRNRLVGGIWQRKN